MAMQPIESVRPAGRGPTRPPKLHRFDEHGIPVALPLSAVFWAALLMVVLK